jgi:hypothetical protein
MANDSTNEFLMHGSRAVLAAFGSAVHIEHQVKTIEQAVFKTPALAFDLAKALIETICRTILQDRGKPYDSTWELNRLFTETTQCLRLVPDSHTADPEVRRSIQKTLTGLNGLVQGLCELRNKGGIASHGHDAFDAPLQPMQALLAARAADALVHYLFSVHRSYVRDPNVGRVRYEDSDDFNEFVDENHEPVKIFELVFQPSEVLFYVDEDGYRAKLAEFQTVKSEEQENAGPTEQPAAT